MDDRLIAALDDCLAALAAGDGTQDVLARYPALAGELRPLVEAARAASALADPALPRQAEMSSRARFLAHAAELRSSAGPTARPRPGTRWSFAARAVSVSLAFLLGLVVGAYGVANVSAQSLPGDPLYGLKRTVERTRLLLSTDPQARAKLEDEFYERRVQEVRTVTAQGRVVPVEFSGRLESPAGERWWVSGVAVVVPAGTEIIGAPSPGRWVTIYGTAQPDMTVLANRVVVSDEEDGGEEEAMPASTHVPAGLTPSATAGQPTAATPEPTPAQVEEVEFTGVVESIGPDAWRIGGRVVAVDAETDIRGGPQVGQTVEVRAVRDLGGRLIARRIEFEDSSGGPGLTQTPEPSETSGSDDDGGPSPSSTPEPDDDDPATATNARGPGDGQSTPSDTPEPAGETVDIEGVLDSISASAWVVAGQTVLVIPETDIRDNPQVGDQVRVRARRQADGRLIAERIEKRSRNPG